jgi:hypothetical protein
MKKHQNNFAFVIYSILFIYVVLRACLLSFTYDESLSYQLVKGDEHISGLANHHVLNTFLMKVCAFCFGEREISLRLPNVLSFLVLVFYLHKLLVFLKLRGGYFIFLPLVLFNPFILDFFSLARGYGLSMAFMTGALYYFLKFNMANAQDRKMKYFLSALIYSALGLCANLALINFYIAAIALSFLDFFIFRNVGGGQLRYFLLILLLALIPLFFGISRLLFLKDAGQLYFGTEDFDYSIASLLERSFYYSAFPPWFGNSIKNAAFYMLPAGLLWALVQRKFNSAFFLVTALLAMILAGLLLERSLFEALYPVGRTGIYLLPLFALFFNLFLEEVLNFLPSAISRGAVIFFSCVISLGFVLHLGSKINFSYCFEWRYDKHTKHVIEKIEKRFSKEAARPVVAVTWFYEPAMQYYRQSRKLRMDIVTWYNSVPMDVIYSINSNAPGEGWQKAEDFPDIETALYYKSDGVPEKK